MGGAFASNLCMLFFYYFLIRNFPKKGKSLMELAGHVKDVRNLFLRPLNYKTEIRNRASHGRKDEERDGALRKSFSEAVPSCQDVVACALSFIK